MSSKAETAARGAMGLGEKRVAPSRPVTTSETAEEEVMEEVVVVAGVDMAGPFERGDSPLAFDTTDSDEAGEEEEGEGVKEGVEE